MQADFSFKMGPCHNRTFPIVSVLCFRPIVRIFILSVIVKLFEANVRTCEIKVSDETHKFVMLMISKTYP